MRDSIPATAAGRLLLIYIVAVALLAGFLYSFLNSYPAMRVGDGSEYYAMALAIEADHRPFVTDKGWAAYSAFHDSGQVAGLQPTEALERAYPALRLGAGTDFNHFWFYSAGAAALLTLSAKTGVALTVHQSFMLLHALMASSLLWLAVRLHRGKGLVAVLTILVLSPVIWFGNKVHTEFFTVVLTTAAIALGLERRWALCALLLAAAATQNISFAAPAGVAWLLALSDLDQSKRRLALIVDASALTLAAMLVVLHPAYYFFRFGVPSPQLLTTGADLSGLSPLSALRYLFDPDVGLLPNWPLGIALCIAWASTANWRRASGSKKFLALSGVFILSSMAAQAASTNLNSGATVHLARYGLWYIGFTYPAILAILAKVPERPSILLAPAVTIAALVLAVLNYRSFTPEQPESYTSPSAAARFVYTYLPGLHDPAVQIFGERNAGIGPAVPKGPAVVVGPGCRKALYIPGNTPTGRFYSLEPCGLTGDIAPLVERKFGTAPTSPRYFSIDESDIDAAAPTISAGATVGPEAVRPYLGTGWSHDEAWGVWSDGKRSTLRVRIPANPEGRLTLIVVVNAFWYGSHDRIEVMPSVDGTTQRPIALNQSLPGPYQLPITLPADRSPRTIKVTFDYDEPGSPRRLGMSDDSRQLSIGITGLRLTSRD